MRAGFFAALSRALAADAPEQAAPDTALSRFPDLSALLEGGAALPRGLGPAMEKTGLFTREQCTLVSLAAEAGRLSDLCPELEADCRSEDRLHQSLSKTADEVARWGLLLLGVFILLMGVVLPLGIRALDGLALSLGKARPLLPRIIGSGGLGLAAAALLCLGGFLLLFYSRHRALAVGWLARLFGDCRSLLFQVNAARFFRGLSLGRTGGLSLREAVYLAAGRIRDPDYQARLSRAVALLEQGQPFSDAAGEAGLLPNRVQAALDRGMGAAALAEEADAGALLALPRLGARIERCLVLGVCGFLGLGVLASLLSLLLLL